MTNESNAGPLTRETLASALARTLEARALPILLAAAVLACAAYAAANRMEPIFPRNTPAPAELAAEESLFYFGAFTETGEPEDVRAALNYIADEIEKNADLVTLERWGLDEDSLKKKRLFLLSASETIQLVDELQTAKELGQGNWNYLAPDLCLERFTKKIGSELTDDRYYGVSDALPFTAALAAAAKGEVSTFSPIAPGLLGRLTLSTAKRVRMGAGGKKGAAAARWNSGAQGTRERPAAEWALRLLDDARNRFPEVEFDLDFPEAEKVVREREAKKVLIRAEYLAACALVLFGPLVFGGFRRTFACALCVGASYSFAKLALAALCPPSPESVAAYAALGGAAAAFAAKQTFLYAESRGKGVGRTESLAGVYTGGRGLAFLALLTIAALASYILCGRGLRSASLGLAIGLPIVGGTALITLPAALRVLDGRDPRSKALRFGTDLKPGVRTFKRVFVIALALVVVLTAGAANTEWSDRLENVFPDNYADSLRGDRIVEVCGKNTAYVRLTPDSEASGAALKERCREESSFRVDDVESNLPDAGPDRRHFIDSIAETLRRTPLSLGVVDVPPQAQLIDAIRRIREAAERAQCVCVDENERVALRQAALDAENAVAELNDREYQARLGAFSSRTMVETVKRLFAFREIAESSPPTRADLSDALKERYAVPDSELFAFYVYSTSDLRDLHALQAFVENIRAICPGAEGRGAARFDAVVSTRRGLTWGSLAWLALLTGLLTLVSKSFFSSAGALAPSAVCALCPIGCFGLTGTPVSPAVFWGAFAVFIVGAAVRGSKRSGERVGGVNDAALLTALGTLAGAIGLAISTAPFWQEFGKALALGACALAAAAYVSAAAEESNESTTS